MLITMYKYGLTHVNIHIGSFYPFYLKTITANSDHAEILPGSYTKRRYRNWTYNKSQHRTQHCTTAHQ